MHKTRMQNKLRFYSNFKAWQHKKRNKKDLQNNKLKVEFAHKLKQ